MEWLLKQRQNGVVPSLEELATHLTNTLTSTAAPEHMNSNETDTFPLSSPPSIDHLYTVDRKVVHYRQYDNSNDWISKHIRITRNCCHVGVMLCGVDIIKGQTSTVPTVDQTMILIPS